ncbi:hypothetical protein [Streptomyces sp. JJ66]|uniref:hypothetical protein n=1 Tax=Streptomyces sp. JJ66 TaxID=2803843 RepID=UPI00214C19C2|nr:hypothetical protein [Streptomyces sp. JJ66]
MTPPPAHRAGPGAGAMTARLLFASFPVWSLGLLAWVPSLRFAILRRRPLDWAVFAAFAAGTVAEILLLAFTPEEPDHPANAAAGGYVLMFLIGAVTHAVLADRFPRTAPTPYGAHAVGYGYPQPAPGPAPTGNGYPQPTPPPQHAVHQHVPPYAAPPYPAPPPQPSARYPHSVHQQPTEYAPPGLRPQPVPQPPSAPQSPSAPQPAAPTAPAEEPARMRQVASELDELDALLRRRDGGQ